MPSGKHDVTLVRIPEAKGLLEPLLFNRRLIAGAPIILESRSHESDMEQGGGWAENKFLSSRGSRLVRVLTRAIQPCRCKLELLLVPFGRSDRTSGARSFSTSQLFQLFIFSLLEQSALGSCIAFSLSSSVLGRSHLSIGSA